MEIKNSSLYTFFKDIKNKGTIALAGAGLVALLAVGCDSTRQVQLYEMNIGDDSCSGRIEVVKNVNRAFTSPNTDGNDTYTINVFGPKGDLKCSIFKNTMMSEDIFILGGSKGILSGNAPVFDKK